MNEVVGEDFDWEAYNKEVDKNSKMKVVLIKPFEGKKKGDEIEVTIGLHNTLVNLGIGISAEELEEDSSYEEKLLMTIKNLTEENKQLSKDLKDHWEERGELLDEIEELKEFKYSNKMMTNIDKK